MKKRSTIPSSGQKNRTPKFIGQAPEHKISFAFTTGGEDYYAFDEDVYFLPFKRGLMATAFYKELQQGVDREYLLWHTGEYDKIFKNPQQFDISRMAILNHQLKERLQFIFEPDIIYKLASVVYFDKTENPYSYSYEYGKKKVEKWKKDEKTEVFFCRQPIKRLIPFLNSQESDILSYLKAAEKIKQQHLKNASVITSSNP